MKLSIPQKKSFSRIDFQLLFFTLILVLFGSIMVFSSSVIMAEARWQAPYHFVFKQIISVGLGAGALLILTNFDYRRLQKFTRPLLVAVFVLLVAVLIFGVEKGGARRWFQMGPLSFQPSELARLVSIIFLADYIDRKKSKMKQWNGIVPAFGMVVLLCALIGLEPDLGTPIIIVCVTFSLLYTSGARLAHLGLICLGAVPIVIVEIIRKPYRLLRIEQYLRSIGEIHSSTYQTNQSILALGSGGFWGKGLGQSQMKLLYLPEPHTDFIFPIIGEELGYVGTMTLIAVFMIIIYRGWRISQHSPDYFGGLLALGITWLIAFQVLLNIGVSIGLLPTKGLPLPFVSFGGTSLIFNCAAIGILLNISKRIHSR